MKRMLFLLLTLMLCVGFGCTCAQAEKVGDGVFQPDGFTWSGGSGRISLSCEKVVLSGENATATIVFSSPNYSRVRLNGGDYEAAHDGETSAFELPLPLNQNVQIFATTTAMSKEREIQYTVCVELDASDAAQPEGLTYESSMEVSYADGFAVDYFEGGYALINVKESGRYLVVPADMPVPDGLDASVTVLKQPVDTVYLAAASAMALFDALDALDVIRLVGTQQSGWYIDGIAQRMESGEMLYAGKYNEPDFELLLTEGCDMAIESTMILHSPKTREMIELLGVPVFIDRSSYETHPLGRTEWIKLYSVLVDKEAQAAAFFDTQTKIIEELKDFENTEKTVAFFYMGSDGTVTVRSSTDYVPSMIEIAGGRYVPGGIADPEGKRSSISLTMEEFYAAAVGADYLIYNATIDNPLSDIGGLLAKSGLFADFKAVKEGNVWCTGKYLYQATDIVGSLITDIHRMLTGYEDGMTFMNKLK